MSFRGCLIVPLSVVVLGAGASDHAADDGTDPCDLFPLETVNQGAGAEPGVTREFASAMSVPPGCQSGGKTFVPFVEVDLTRVSGGPVDLPLEVFIRAVDPNTGLPIGDMTPPHSVLAEGIEIFPNSTTCEFATLPPDSHNINNALWGDYFFIAAAFSGDNQLVYVTVDEVGLPGDPPCFTGIDGQVPTDPCTNGNPNLSTIGLGAQTYTFYGRYVDGDQVAGREPLGTTFEGRYHAADQSGGGPVTDLRLVDGRGGPVVCSYTSVPPDFYFQCPMTAPQSYRLNNGDFYMERESGGDTQVARVHSAWAFGFASGFELGNTSEWFTAVP